MSDQQDDKFSAPAMIMSLCLLAMGTVNLVISVVEGLARNVPDAQLSALQAIALIMFARYVRGR